MVQLMRAWGCGLVGRGIWAQSPRRNSKHLLLRPTHVKICFGYVDVYFSKKKKLRRRVGARVYIRRRLPLLAVSW